MLLADIAHGKVDAADVLFLIGFILALLAALASIPVWAHRAPTGDTRVGISYGGWAPVLGWLAVALVALAFMLL